MLKRGLLRGLGNEEVQVEHHKIVKSSSINRLKEHQKLSPSFALGLTSLHVKKTIKKMNKNFSCW